MASALLAALLTSACATTTEYVYLQPRCQPAPEPVLHDIDAGALWDAVGDDTYRKLEQNQSRLVTWALLNADIVRNVCEAPE